MKKSIQSVFFAFVVLTVLLSGCTPVSTPAPTMIPPTFTPLPIDTLVPTNTPEPTFTPEPSPTPVLLPDVLHQTFLGVSVTYHDSFQYVIHGMTPQGWQTDQQNAIWITEENQLKAQPLPSSVGTVFYYSGETIIPNTGVYFTFKYSGTSENFTLGFDNVDANGERILGPDFRSVAMEVSNQNLIVYRNDNRATSKGLFEGNLRLLEDTWYDIALAFDENHNFIIKIWQPESPEKQLTYLRNWQDFPDRYYFISWINSKRSLLIDDYTVFNFDKIVQK
jgi:hypothetical protein